MRKIKNGRFVKILALSIFFTPANLRAQDECDDCSVLDSEETLNSRDKIKLLLSVPCAHVDADNLKNIDGDAEIILQEIIENGSIPIGVRASATRVLGDFRTVQTKRYLWEILGAPEIVPHAVLLAAIEAYAKNAGGESVEMLKSYFEIGEAESMLKAIQMMKKYGGKAGENALRERLRVEQDYFVRKRIEDILKSTANNTIKRKR